MKKFLAVILCLVLAFGCCYAMAEDNIAISQKVSVTVGKYALAYTSTDDLIFWDATGEGSNVIEVSGGSGNRASYTVLTFSAEGYTDLRKEVASSDGKITITPADIKKFLNNTADTVLVTITSTSSTVTKNGIVSSATDAKTIQVLVLDEKSIVDDGLVFTTTTLSIEDLNVFPGDKFVVTGTIDYSSLITKLGGRATVNIDYVKIYTDRGDDSEDVLNGTGTTLLYDYNNNTASTTGQYTVPSVNSGTVITFWTIGKVSLTAK